MVRSRAYYLASLAITLVLSCGMGSDPALGQPGCSDTLRLRCEGDVIIELNPSDYAMEPNQAGYYLVLKDADKLQHMRSVKAIELSLCIEKKPYVARAGKAFSATLPEGADFHFATSPSGTMVFSKEGSILLSRIER